MKNIFSTQKGNVVTIYVPNNCLNELNKSSTLQIIEKLEEINQNSSIDMVIFRTIQENFFLPKFCFDNTSITTDAIVNSDYFINLTDMIHNMRAMTVAVFEGSTNTIGSSFLQANDLSYATENAIFSNDLNLANTITAKAAEDLGLITRVIPSDKIDITLDYLIHTSTLED
ncbi:Clp protease/crotonase-like domain-containing protein [Flammeovirga kamogawensis]|uniref:Uncharacterized protein n=1 Tax=Flammeovirga kamogawensis TaxID=373891 RepID=A0ABX8GS22_9BACT|nr:hypothetical protein [Flammeovirga kamogawensis]MBB6463185.1 enoyl-CoA hydratase/carnithine racemase [Flammeovirga kamogawensis]QWG05962.1 hypothetical protein KM029_11340 [Flammeovirga kamogawensis]TRX67788.1 hypothetical protein EO216_06350 [Flammeovirga kamogawensis]